MSKILKFMAKVDYEMLTLTERQYLTSVLADNDELTLEGIWSLIDDAWEECKCEREVIDERIGCFYEHPVWLLNGFFTEQHAESLNHRQDFTAYVDSLKPLRVADFGGGYGTLARMIGVRCPATEVHIIEPHPHAIAIALANQIPNVSYVPALSGEYDILIATDVFEHVSNPLALIESTAVHLRMWGEYLIANCFWPVIHCHLPSTFHFRWSWDAAMNAMNLRPGQAVSYGRAYQKTGLVSSFAARKIENRSKRWFRLIEQMPRRIQAKIARVLI